MHGNYGQMNMAIKDRCAWELWAICTRELRTDVQGIMDNTCTGIKDRCTWELRTDVHGNYGQYVHGN